MYINVYIRVVERCYAIACRKLKLSNPAPPKNIFGLDQKAPSSGLEWWYRKPTERWLEKLKFKNRSERKIAVKLPFWRRAGVLTFIDNGRGEADRKSTRLNSSH